MGNKEFYGLGLVRSSYDCCHLNSEFLNEDYDMVLRILQEYCKILYIE